MPTLSHDEKYMSRCLQLALNGLHDARPNPMVGAVIVSSEADGSRILGEGWHRRYGEAHAEVNAFAAVSEADEALLPDSTIYVSLEPCSHWGKTPPCVDLIIKKGVRRVVVGCLDSYEKVAGRGIDRLRQAGIEVVDGVLDIECLWLNHRFFTFHNKHRPYIILKWAQSSNGYIDDCGKPYLFSNERTLRLSHRLRAEEDAIVVGHTTWLRDQPQLTVRQWDGPNPKRLVIDRQHPLNLEVLHAHHIQSLIVEGGRKTLDSFLEQGLWDEIRVETNMRLTVGGGTRAPQLPADAEVVAQHDYDGNMIISYRSRLAPRPISGSPI